MVDFFTSNDFTKKERKRMDLDIKQLTVALRAIAEEKNLPEETVQDIVEQALAAAYKKDYGDREQEVSVSVNLHTGDVDAYISKTVSEPVEDPQTQISLSDAQVIKKNAEIGEVLVLHQDVSSFGRVAAQTAKQVILQKLREAEREIIVDEYQDKINTILNGIVARVDGNVVRVDLGKVQGILPASEQIQGEHYYSGQRLKVFLKDVEKGPRGPQLVLSRGSTQFIEWLFRAEVPEMENGAVAIKSIAREAGVRSKIAVVSNVQGVDPVGTFVGGHGIRVNAVMSEIGEQEKIDIIVWSANSKEFVINALSPTTVSKVEIDEKSKKAIVHVPEDQLSIAIGKSGQNVRLASKLTEYEIDIIGDKSKPISDESTKEPKEQSSEPKIATPIKKKSELESSLLEAIEEHGE